MAPPNLATDISWVGSSRRKRATRELQPSPEVDSLWVGTTSLLSSSSRLMTSVRRVQELARLPEGWDSYGARKIQPPALEAALRVLRVADSDLLPAPHLSPVADGGVQVEWSVGDRCAEVEIRPTGTLEFLVQLGEEIAEGSSPRPEDARPVIELLLRG